MGLIPQNAKFDAENEIIRKNAKTVHIKKLQAENTVTKVKNFIFLSFCR
jgi:hypothetical protein